MVSVSVLARMVVASVSQIRANDVTNPLWRWLYDLLRIAGVTVQLFYRSIATVGQAPTVATREWPCTLQHFRNRGCIGFDGGCEVAWRMPRG